MKLWTAMSLHTHQLWMSMVFGKDRAAMGDRIPVKGRAASESGIPNEDKLQVRRVQPQG